MGPRRSILVLVVLMLFYQGTCTLGAQAEDGYYNCVRETARLPPLSVPRPTCRLSAQVISNLTTVEGCSSLRNYLPILNSLSNTQNLNLTYNGTNVSLFDAAHDCFMNLTKELCCTHELCIACIDNIYSSTDCSTFYEIEACRMFVYEELTRGEERSNYELYKFMTLIEALYSTGYYSGSRNSYATSGWCNHLENATYDGYTQAFLNHTCTTDVHDCVRDLILGCFHLLEFFDAGPYQCYREIENRICSKYIDEDAFRCDFVLEGSINSVYGEVCQKSQHQTKCGDIFADILTDDSLIDLDIKVIQAIINSKVIDDTIDILEAFELLDLAVERFNTDQSYVATLVDDRDADGFLNIFNTLLNKSELEKLEKANNDSSTGISLLDNLNDVSKLLALGLIEAESLTIPTNYTYNASNLYMFLESSSPKEDYTSNDLSLMGNNGSASIIIPASQICQYLTPTNTSTIDYEGHTPDDEGFEGQIPMYGGDNGLVNPWPWCPDVCTDGDFDFDDYGDYNFDNYNFDGYGYNYGGYNYGGGNYGDYNNDDDNNDDDYCITAGFDNECEIKSSSELLQLFLDCDIPKEIDQECLTVVATSVTQNIPRLLADTLPNNTEIASLMLSSQIVTNISDDSPANNISSQPLTENATLNFVLNKRVNLETSTPICHYWDNEARVWSTEGVETVIISDVEVECIASHLTSFAVLVDHQSIQEMISGGERLALEITGYVGLTISVICLIVAVIVMLCMRKRMSSSPLYYIHLNLSISLLLALALLLIGLTTATDIRALCGVIAGLLHYLFLCVFCWMLSEGIWLLLSVVDVFGTVTKRWYLALPLGWGLPVPIVAISAGIRHQQYGTSQHCWLSADKGVIWAFIGPMIAICVVNTVFLIIVMIKITQLVRRKAQTQARKNLEAIKSAVVGTIILMPLLGITWIIGIFAIGRDSTVFLWIFTICNSLQGGAILIFHIFRNKEVQKALTRCIRNKRGLERQSTVTSGFFSETRRRLSSLSFASSSQGNRRESNLSMNVKSFSEDNGLSVVCENPAIEEEEEEEP